MMRQILAVEQFEKARVSHRARSPVVCFCFILFILFCSVVLWLALLSHRVAQGDGRILFELMAYGTTVLDEEHRSNCLYFMAVMFALSSADPPTAAQRELNISTHDLVYFFRVDGKGWSAGQIMSMFVELLEQLTYTRQGPLAFLSLCI